MKVAALAVALVLAAAAPATAAPPPIVRPADAAKLSPRELGAQLFAGNCARCHGGGGAGLPAGGDAGAGPPLLGAGAQAADFYLRTGYMPLGEPSDQPVRSRVRFREHEIRVLVDYVAGLGGGGPPVPRVDPGAGSLSEGQQLFTDHCAGCHQVVAEGGVVTSVRVPPLDRATPAQIAEAVRIGPYVMPAFPEEEISDDELDSIVAYVQYAKHPDDAGGWGIDHLGPFPEGLVTWLIAAVCLIGVCVLIGKRMGES